MESVPQGEPDAVPLYVMCFTFLNAFAVIDATVSGMIIFSIEVQFANAPTYILPTVLGIVIFFNDVQFMNFLAL